MIELLPWDSEFFGARIARAEVDGDVGRIVEEARADAVDCVYLLVPGIALDTAAEAIRRGAILTDLRLVLERVGVPPSDAPIKRATASDVSTVEGLAARLAALSRFARDPRIGAHRVEEMYRVWARSCLETGVVALGPENQALVGIRVAADVAHVDLVYVSPASSGAGLARSLIASALAEAAAPRAEVATQFGNVPALRAYEALGFRARAASTILHVWLDAWH